MIWRTPSRRSFGLLVLALTVACGTESTSAKPVATHKPKRSTTTSTTTTTSPYAPATTTTSVLPLTSVIKPKQRDEIQYAWATVVAAQADIERGFAAGDPEIIRRSPYLYGAAQTGYADDVVNQVTQGIIVTFPPGSMSLKYRGFELKDWGYLIDACFRDGGIQTRKADGVVVDDVVYRRYLRTTVRRIDGMWKLSGTDFVTELEGKCAGV